MAAEIIETCVACCDNCLTCRTTTDDVDFSLHWVSQDCFCATLTDGLPLFTMSYDADLDAWVGTGEIVFCSEYVAFTCVDTVAKTITALFTQTCGCQGFLRVIIEDCYDQYFTRSYGSFTGVGVPCEDPLGDTFCAVGAHYTDCTDIAACCVLEDPADPACQENGVEVIVQWGLGTFDGEC